jgi:hypothetical protein
LIGGSIAQTVSRPEMASNQKSLKHQVNACCLNLQHLIQPAHYLTKSSAAGLASAVYH